MKLLRIIYSFEVSSGSSGSKYISEIENRTCYSIVIPKELGFAHSVSISGNTVYYDANSILLTNMGIQSSDCIIYILTDN